MKVITFEYTSHSLTNSIAVSLVISGNDDYVTRLVLESRLALQQRRFLIHCLPRGVEKGKNVKEVWRLMVSSERFADRI